MIRTVCNLDVIIIPGLLTSLENPPSLPLRQAHNDTLLVHVALDVLSSACDSYCEIVIRILTHWTLVRWVLVRWVLALQALAPQALALQALALQAFVR